MAYLLLVDDEPNVVTLLQYLLEAAGHEVKVLGDGTEAVEFLQIGSASAAERLPDLILSDVNMPHMDGYTLATKLCEDTRTRPVPVIVLTTKGQLKESFTALGNVAGFLEKPFQHKDLSEIIVKTLRAKPAH